MNVSNCAVLEAIGVCRNSDRWCSDVATFKKGSSSLSHRSASVSDQKGVAAIVFSIALW